jgi:anti-sigma factor ChrR (cupin superfamily)
LGTALREVIMVRRLIALAFILACANTAIAADDMKMPTNSGDLKWGPAPPVLPKGAEITVLSGDPSKDAPYVIRLKMPSGYLIPAHNHPTTENVTVISGNFHIGMGDKFDEKKGIELTAGGYAEAPAKMNHYAWTSSATIVQVHGQGPATITYVNPADDPSKQ